MHIVIFNLVVLQTSNQTGTSECLVGRQRPLHSTTDLTNTFCRVWWWWLSIKLLLIAEKQLTAVTAKKNTAYSPKWSVQSFAELLLASFDRSWKVCPFLVFLFSLKTTCFVYIEQQQKTAHIIVVVHSSLKEACHFTWVHKTITGIVEKSGIKYDR